MFVCILYFFLTFYYACAVNFSPHSLWTVMAFCCCWILQLRKVYDQGVSFSGCFSNVVYGAATLPLWPSALVNASRAVCCQKPASTTFPSIDARTQPGVTFHGFGHIAFRSQTSTRFDSGSLAVRLIFRTFAPDAVILLLTNRQSNVTDFCGIFLIDGKLRLVVMSGANSAVAEAQHIYNTGDWYEVCIEQPAIGN